MAYLNEQGKKIAVIGSRTFNDKDRLFKILDKNRHKIKAILSGGAQGADSLAQEWAKERGFLCMTFYARWRDEYGNFDKGAGFKRNFEIIKNADAVIAFWDKVSGGTANSLEIAEKLNKPVKIFEFTPTEEPTKEVVESPIDPATLLEPIESQPVSETL